VLVTVSFPTITYQLRSEKDHQKADGPGVRSPAPPPRKRPAPSVRGVFISLQITCSTRGNDWPVFAAGTHHVRASV